MDTQTQLAYMKGVGPGRAEILGTKGMRTVEDLLGYAPFRYEDRSSVRSISQLAPGETATVLARVHMARASSARGRHMDLFEITFVDATGSRLVGKWFHGGYLANVLVPGMQVALFGKAEFDSFTRGMQMLHPEFEVIPEDDDPEVKLHMGRIVPIYEAVGKVTTRIFRSLIHRALEEIAPVDDQLPQRYVDQYKLPSYWEALRHLHFPPPGEDLRALNAFRSPAHWRMIYEEFFWLECGLALRRARAKSARGIQFELNDRVRDKIRAMLPFRPTAAQKKALGEIARDMASPQPMNRLLQGDVGSGKTLVAAQAAIIAIENGCQAALLAPTEILATQHYFNLRRLFEKIGYLTVVLTGSNTAKEKQQIKRLVAGGMVPMVVGTHALLEQDVEFHRLGLVVIDEQHRFGVVQRQRLQQKGETPDVLVMTATPIPRTLALTMYGDLDTSVIDEMPPGRQPIRTRHFDQARSDEVWGFVRGEVAQGRQAYVVCPAIEESEAMAMRAAEKTHTYLSQTVFTDLEVGLLHGKLKSDAKEELMDRFLKGEIHVLVATTVVEVGVDVANATVMVVEQADRFGLAQLHQLRGRVGRGSHQSHCILVTGKMGEKAYERIKTLLDSSDGFYIAEMDLRLRGPGEFFGTRQSGLAALRIADLIRDREILELARSDTASLVENPPSPEELDRAEAFLRDHWQRRYGLSQVG